MDERASAAAVLRANDNGGYTVPSRGAVEGGGMREYFGPESGRGLGARDFAWTAALYLREVCGARAG